MQLFAVVIWKNDARGGPQRISTIVPLHTEPKLSIAPECVQRNCSCLDHCETVSGDAAKLRKTYSCRTMAR